MVSLPNGSSITPSTGPVTANRSTPSTRLTKAQSCPALPYSRLNGRRVEHADEHRDEQIRITDGLGKRQVELRQDSRRTALAQGDCPHHELDERGQNRGVDAFSADIRDEDERAAIGEAVDVEDVAADRQVIRRREVRAAHFAVRQRNGFAAVGALQYLA